MQIERPEILISSGFLFLIVQDKKYCNNLDASQLDACYPVIVQSGGDYKLKFSVSSDKVLVSKWNSSCWPQL